MNLRYHHLEQLLFLEDAFSRWKQDDSKRQRFGENRLAAVTFDSLYSDPEIGKAYIDDFIEFQIETIVNVAQRRYRHPDFPSLDHVCDYVGAKTEHSEEFKLSYTDSLVELLLSDPNTVVEITYAPDAICGSCQRKSPKDSQYGIHCVDELYNIQDFQWEKALNSLVSHNSFDFGSYVQKTQTEDGIVMTTRIGLLRQPDFLGSLSDSFDETNHEFARRGGPEGLIREGILEIRNSPILIARATDSYLRGERDIY